MKYNLGVLLVIFFAPTRSQLNVCSTTGDNLINGFSSIELNVFPSNIFASKNNSILNVVFFSLITIAASFLKNMFN